MIKGTTLWIFGLWVSISLFQVPLGATGSKPENSETPKKAVTSPPESIVQRYRLNPFYKKYLDADGIAVTSSENVADEALYETAYLIGHVLQNRPDLLELMSRSNTRMIVIGADEEVSEIPEYYKADPQEAARQNRRVRGYGGRRLVSCGQENLLNLSGDRYRGENIFIHEFAHSIHSNVRRLEPDFQQTLDRLYRQARAKGLWERTYAGTNAAEYWAEGVQSYFDCNQKSRRQGPDGVHNHVNTREKLREYDPELYDLIDRTLGPMDWRYTRYIDRQTKTQDNAQ